MFIAVSQIIILVTGISICMFALWGIYAPHKLMEWFKGMAGNDWIIYPAVIVRLILGVALIVAASSSQLPLVFLILGWVAIIAGIAIAFMGTERLREFIYWLIERLSATSIRLWLLFALVFGGALIYGVS